MPWSPYHAKETSKESNDDPRNSPPPTYCGVNIDGSEISWHNNATSSQASMVTNPFERGSFMQETADGLVSPGVRMVLANPEHMGRSIPYDSHFSKPLSANTDQLEGTIMLADQRLQYWEDALIKGGDPLQYLAASHLSTEKGKAKQMTSTEDPDTDLTGKPR